MLQLELYLKHCLRKGGRKVVSKGTTEGLTLKDIAKGKHQLERSVKNPYIGIKPKPKDKE